LISWCLRRSYELMPQCCPLAAGGIHPCDVSCKSKSRNALKEFVGEHQIDASRLLGLTRGERGAVIG
ncbi:hypothetical protein PIB30_075696, partial [Stylosanthes scabra]|nr:hypothetical protein [Stylosanthes scabra]